MHRILALQQLSYAQVKHPVVAESADSNYCSSESAQCSALSIVCEANANGLPW